jgi:hypothetical protein
MIVSRASIQAMSVNAFSRGGGLSARTRLLPTKSIVRSLPFAPARRGNCIERVVAAVMRLSRNWRSHEPSL